MGDEMKSFGFANQDVVFKNSPQRDSRLVLNISGNDYSEDTEGDMLIIMEDAFPLTSSYQDYEPEQKLLHYQKDIRNDYFEILNQIIAGEKESVNCFILLGEVIAIRLTCS